MNRVVLRWMLLGLVGYLLLPWYVLEDGFWGFSWLFSGGFIFDGGYAPAWAQVLFFEKSWLAPLPLFLLLPLAGYKRSSSDPIFSSSLLIAGVGGLGCLVIQGLSIGIDGWEFSFLNDLFGPLSIRQFGMGYGAVAVALPFLFFLTQGIAARGAIRGDVFVVGSIGLIMALIVTFIFFPLSHILVSALENEGGIFSLWSFFDRFASQGIWGLKCLYGGGRCGVAWNSLLLALLVGVSTTFLGFLFALVATRSGFKRVRLLKSLAVLPIITPPFVISLSLILLFGLSGTVTLFISDLLGITPSRWLYGLPGIWLAQVLAYTPIAFLVMIGVVEGVSPSLEEAAMTLRAGKWKTFIDISFPLMRPGLANAFLIGFIESMADFGNPMVLGGNYDVLSTEIFFSIVGSQNDQGRAATLAIVLLFFTLSAFYLQRRWLGKKSYVTVTGKGDSGVHPPLPTAIKPIIYSITLFWLLFTLVVYFMILFGSFVETWGLDNSLTFKHYVTAFSAGLDQRGIYFDGSAWNSFFTTISIATIAAPLTAAIGLLTAYLLVRQKFRGLAIFEFGTMLSFAIPGTVIGISYILAFNVPPIELTATGSILVLCFIFRNMPVGVRAGVAAMSQLDKNLDEASLTLGGNSWYSFRNIILPLLRPAIVAALVYSFVRAITAISAVIFLVSSEYDMATSYIIGRVENNDYGLAIAYSTVLIIFMLLAVLALQFIVGKRNLGRRLRR
ncbi:MAG: iron ABC transporter permease [SAR324 cluster bacterium]|nr:iron ABC transporter permease [SAR324 cluster bacterium]